MSSSGTINRPSLRVITDERGRTVQVFVGSVEITHLVKRTQTVTEPGGTLHEVVLRVFLPEITREPIAPMERTA